MQDSIRGAYPVDASSVAYREDRVGVSRNRAGHALDLGAQPITLERNGGHPRP